MRMVQTTDSLLNELASLSLSHIDLLNSSFACCHKYAALAIIDDEGTIVSRNERFTTFIPEDSSTHFDSIFSLKGDVNYQAIFTNSKDKKFAFELQSVLRTNLITYDGTIIPVGDDKRVLIVESPQARATTKETILNDPRLLDSLYSSVALVKFMPDGTIIDANDPFLKLTRYSLSEIQGKHHKIFVDSDTKASPEYQSFWKDLAKGKVSSNTFPRHDKYGQKLWLFGNYLPIRNSEGEVYEIVKLCFDITNQREIELDFSAKIEALDRTQAVIEFTPQGKILTANANFLNTMKYSLEQIVDRHHSIFVTKAEAESVEYREFWHELAKGIPSEGTFNRIDSQGELVHIQGTYSPIFDVKGQVIKVVKFCNDITESVRLRARADTLSKALDANNCVWEMDLDHQILSANENFHLSMGYTPGSLIGVDELSLIHKKDSSDGDFAEHWRQLRLGKAIVCETRRLDHDQKEVWFRATFQPLFNAIKQVEKVLVIAQDITDEKYKSLDTNAKLQAIERSDAVIEFTPEGTILRTNANFNKLMEYETNELAGQHHKLLVDRGYAETIEYQNFWKSLSRGEYFTNEFKRITKSGKEVWIQATYNPVFDLSGNVTKVVKFATDITEAKHKNSEFAARVASIDHSLATIEFDLEGNVLTANHNFLSAMGYTLKEIQGQHHAIFCSGDYVRSEEYRTFWLDLSEGKYLSGRYHRLGKFNRNVWIQAAYNPIFDLDGNAYKVIKYAYDITKEMELEHMILDQSKSMSSSINTVYELLERCGNYLKDAAEVSNSAEKSAREGEALLGNISNSWTTVQDAYENISEIVKRITEISSQTNLLAFNAAVEASRAGAHGAGFSVVASEVRRLAEDSAKAAEQISTQVSSIKNNITQGNTSSRDAMKAFQSIVENVSETKRLIDVFEDAQKTQHSTAKEVNATLQQLQQVVIDGK